MGNATSTVTFTDTPTSKLAETVITSAIDSSFTSILNTPLPSTLNTTSPTNPPGTSGSVAAGTAAGIGVGLFFAGIIAAVIFTRLFQQRLCSKPLRRYPNAAAKAHRSVPIQPRQPNDILLDQAGDGRILKHWATLFGNIADHVNYFYHDQTQEAPQIQNISDCGLDKMHPLSAEELGSLINSGLTRPKAIRYLLASLIISRIRLGSVPKLSLLPSVIAYFIYAIPKEGPSSHEKAVFQKVLSQWRTNSVFLLKKKRLHLEPLSVKEVDISEPLKRNLELLRPILCPLLKEERDVSDWELKLDALLTEGAEFGITLFSQKTSWTFGWDRLEKVAIYRIRDEFPSLNRAV